MDKKKLLIGLLIAFTLASAMVILVMMLRKKGTGSLFSRPDARVVDLSPLPRDIFPLMQGVTSREVALYQVYLNQKEALNLTIDGIWGPLTEAASQKIHGWSVMDMANYAINIKPREPALISLARQSHNTLIAA